MTVSTISSFALTTMRPTHFTHMALFFTNHLITMTVIYYLHIFGNSSTHISDELIDEILLCFFIFLIVLQHFWIFHHHLHDLGNYVLQSLRHLWLELLTLDESRRPRVIDMLLNLSRCLISNDIWYQFLILYDFSFRSWSKKLLSLLFH